MNFKLAAAAAALFAGAMAQVAHANGQDEVSGWYLGGGVGQFNAGIDNVDQVDNTIDNWKDKDTAYKFFGGYRLNPYLALELDYMNLGKPSGAVVPGFNVDASVDGFAPYFIGTIPLGKFFEVYGRLGYYFYDATVGHSEAFNDRVEFDEESRDLVWGGGIGANIGEKLNLRLEYERFDLKGLSDADALWLTAAWRF